MNKKSLISIIMPAYNAEKYIVAAIESILNQTYPHFELLIFDDYSTDNTVSIIKNIDDPRIHLFTNTQNVGQEKNYNKGIAMAKGEYIAIMHADDIALARRIEKQFHFLENNFNYALVGSQAYSIFNDNTDYKKPFHVSTNSELIPIISLFTSPFIHPSVMIRSEILKSFLYREGFTAAEDYELWSRILKKHSGTNLNIPLLLYRFHGNNISSRQNSKQIESIKKIYASNLSQINIPQKEIILNSLIKVSGCYHQGCTSKEWIEVEKCLIQLRDHLIHISFSKKDHIISVIESIWHQFCIKNIGHAKIKGPQIYLQSKLNKNKKIKNTVALCIHGTGKHTALAPVYNFLRKKLPYGFKPE